MSLHYDMVLLLHSQLVQLPWSTCNNCLYTPLCEGTTATTINVSSHSDHQANVTVAAVNYVLAGGAVVDVDAWTND